MEFSYYTSIDLALTFADGAVSRKVQVLYRRERGFGPLPDDRSMDFYHNSDPTNRALAAVIPLYAQNEDTEFGPYLGAIIQARPGPEWQITHVTVLYSYEPREIAGKVRVVAP